MTPRLPRDPELRGQLFDKAQHQPMPSTSTAESANVSALALAERITRLELTVAQWDRRLVAIGERTDRLDELEPPDDGSA